MKSPDKSRRKRSLDDAAGSDASTSIAETKETDEKNLLIDIKSIRDNIINNRKANARTKRISVVTSPGLYENCKAIAYEKGISLNELINRLLENTVETNGKYV